MLRRTDVEKIQNQLDMERKLVSFDNYDLTVRELLSMLDEENVIIPPEYQRQFIWDVKRQSTLIESIYLGIPVPNIFMATNSDASWEIVDGVQRISTLAHYCGTRTSLKVIDRDNYLKIEGIEKLTSINDRSFFDLPKSIQLSFVTRPIRITVLNDKSDSEVRFDLFERLNTGGILLSPQEIRNCIYRGPFNEALKKLAKIEDFNKSIKLKPADNNNGTKEELVLRFFSFYDTYLDFEHSVKDFLNGYMKIHARKKLSLEKIQIFKETFRFIRNELPNGINRGKRALTPINLFEAIAVGTALALTKSKTLKMGVLSDLKNSKKLQKLTTGATNTPNMVRGRIEYVRDNLLIK